MLTITGLHHVSLPAADVERSSDWHERVPGFVPILMAEGEDVVTMIVTKHRCRVLRCLRLAPRADPRTGHTGRGIWPPPRRVPLDRTEGSGCCRSRCRRGTAV
jgi:catechol 2,3-dioxygenase-like lactoylglutathione lyase family enzyme